MYTIKLATTGSRFIAPRKSVFDGAATTERSTIGDEGRRENIIIIICMRSRVAAAANRIYKWSRELTTFPAYRILKADP